MKINVINILLNQYFNPVVIAARSIASSINNMVSSFSANFSLAMRPPIIKHYSSGKMNEMLVLLYGGVKLTFFLMYLFALPLILEVPIILKLWLGNFPVYSVIFVRLMLVQAIIDVINHPLGSVILATGKIKVSQIVTSSILILNFPLSLIVLELGAEPSVIMIISIFLTLIQLQARIFVIKHLIPFFPVRYFYTTILFPLGIVTLVSCILRIILYVYLSPGFLQLVIIVITSVVSICFSMWIIGLNNSERRVIRNIIESRLLIRRNYTE
jgi:O-antigen/teichoic acid export membrane protein